MSKFVRIKSDYDPDTCMNIVLTDDMDVSVGIYGEGEFKLAGINGGGQRFGDRKIQMLNLFSQIIDIAKLEES